MGSSSCKAVPLSTLVFRSEPLGTPFVHLRRQQTGDVTVHLTWLFVIKPGGPLLDISGHLYWPIPVSISYIAINAWKCTWLMPQSHLTTGPARFLSPVRFLARKAGWSARRNFTSVLFPWSHQATGPVRLDRSVYLWFGWTIRRTPRVPRAMPVRAPYGPHTVIFNVLRDPCGTHAGPARVPYGALTDT